MSKKIVSKKNMDDLEHLLEVRKQYVHQLEKNVQECKRAKILKLEKEEQEKLVRLKEKYALKRQLVEATPHNGSIGLQQKIAQLDKEIACYVQDAEGTEE